MATIKEIAHKAGVSPTTVSNVLHGNTKKLSEHTLRKVQSVLQSERYAPNMGAVMLASNNSRIIGVITCTTPRGGETVVEDPFTAALIGTLEREIRSKGYFMMLHAAEHPDEILRLASTWKLQGLIMLWIPRDICSSIKKQSTIPIVFIDCYFNNDGYIYHNVGLDDEASSYAMTRYLIDNGHKRIAFLGNFPDHSGGETARLKGFTQALRENNIRFDARSVKTLSKDMSERRALYQSLSKKPCPFSALFFSADYYAAEALHFFQAHAVAVPNDISVVGFDNNIFSRLTTPALTTVHQDISEKGRCSVAMLMDIIRGAPVAVPVIRLPTHIEIRSSVKTL